MRRKKPKLVYSSRAFGQTFRRTTNARNCEPLVLPRYRQADGALVETVMNVDQKKTLFLASDTDGDGTLCCSELARSLDVLGIPGVTTDRLAELLRQADISVPADIMQLELDFNQYDQLLWHIGLSDLFTEHEEKADPGEWDPAIELVRCVDWGLMYVEGLTDNKMCYSSHGGARMYQKAAEGTSTRWLDLEVDPVNTPQKPIRRIGVAYHLHPDAVADSTHYVSPKVETYGSHTHIVLPVVAIVKAPTNFQMRRHWRLLGGRPPTKWPLDFHLQVDNLSIFVVRLPGTVDTIITVRPVHTTSCGSACVEPIEGLLRAIAVPYSRLRMGGPMELLHQMISEMLRIAEGVLQEVNGALEVHIAELHGSKGTGSTVNAVPALTQDVVHIKMVQAVLISLTSTVASFETTIDDIIDDTVLALAPHHKTMLERLKSKAVDLSTTAEAVDTSSVLLINEINNRIRYHHAESNTLLSVVVTVIMPLQVFSGLWGMNCDVPFQNGTDFGWDGGQKAFTILLVASIALGLIILYAFRLKGWF